MRPSPQSTASSKVKARAYNCGGHALRMAELRSTRQIRRGAACERRLVEKCSGGPGTKARTEDGLPDDAPCRVSAPPAWSWACGVRFQHNCIGISSCNRRNAQRGCVDRRVGVSGQSATNADMSVVGGLAAAFARGRRVTRKGYTQLTSKFGPRTFYKGKGCLPTGTHTRKGSS